MVISNLIQAQNTASLAAGQPQPTSNYRGQAGQPVKKDLEGYEGVGTYGVNFTDDGEGGMWAELNSAVAKAGRYSAGAYPARQLPELYGLTKDSFELALNAVISRIIADHGEQQEDGLVSLNFQPVEKGVNINYQDRLNFCVAVAPNKFFTVAGLFEPNQAAPSASGGFSLADMVNAQQSERQRDPYMIRIGTKSRVSNVILKYDTGLTMMRRDGAKLPLTILVDKLEAAPRAHIKGIQLTRMTVREAAPAPVSQADNETN